MAEQTSSSIVIDAPPAAVMDVIADFPAYPEWAKGVKEALVRSELPGGRAAEVFFALDVAPIKDEYTLAYTWNDDRDVSWTLAEGKMLRALDGAYVLSDRGDGSTEVTYRLALDVSIPLIGMIKRKGEKILIDTALKGLKLRVESLGLTAPTQVRVLLFTGKGGVGKSTLAAGTAALAADAGHRTLVLSTDAAHSLADAFGVPAGPEPTEVGDLLWVQQVDAQLRFEQSWADIQRYLLTVLDVAGVDPVAAEELTVIPGAEEVLALLELRLHAASGRWDVVVVDCAPTAETLRLLALPEALGWYMERVLPVERRVVKALRPVLSKAAGVPMPTDSVFDAIERLHAELDEVRTLLTGPDSSVRLVLTPEAVVLAEARRSWTTLSLFGYRVDGVIANRVFPAEGADDWRAGWVLAQDTVLAEVAESFAGLPLWRSEYRPAEPVGRVALTAMALDVYAGGDPLAVPEGEGPFRVTRTGTGAVLHLALPLVSSAEVDLARNGDELVVTVGSYRRLLTVPAGLTRHRVAGARVVGGELQVRFAETERTVGQA